MSNSLWLPWTAAHQASLSTITSWSLPKLISIELVLPSNHLILCHPLLLLPSIIPSIRVFSNESALRIRWPKYWSFSFNISPSNEHSGLISLQSKGLSRVFSNTTVQKHQFFGTQLSLQSNSHPYMATGKTIALTRWTFVGKVMSLLLKMLSRLVITFLPRSKCLLISWLQSASTVILEPKKIKSLLVGAQTWITVILNGLPWKWTEIILSLLRLHPIFRSYFYHFIFQLTDSFFCFRYSAIDSF